MTAAFTNRLQKSWARDIVTIVSAGNNPPRVYLDRILLQRLGTPGNGLITVGGVALDGALWPNTTPARGLGGSITVYAAAAGVGVALANSDTGTGVSSGTSLAAPAVVSGPSPSFLLLTILRLVWPLTSSVCRRWTEIGTKEQCRQTSRIT